MGRILSARLLSREKKSHLPLESFKAVLQMVLKNHLKHLYLRLDEEYKQEVAEKTAPDPAEHYLSDAE